MDKVALQNMMKEMAAIGSKYGFEVTPAGGSLGVGTAKIKFSVSETQINESGQVVRAVSGAAISAAKYEDIDVNKTFTYQGKTHRIVDYHPRKYKQPWITEASDGKTYKWSTSSIKGMYLRQGMPKVDGLAGLMA